MKCSKHPKKEASGTCVGCGNFFCEDCFVTVGRKNYCKECASEHMQAHNESKEKQPIVITQQVTQHAHDSENGKPRGSGGWLCFWIIVFWPVAIFYYFSRRWN